MLSLEQVNAEIEKLENNGGMNSRDCANLANLYMIRDKLEHKNMESSHASEHEKHYSEMPKKEARKTIDLAIYPAKKSEEKAFTKAMADEWTSHMENEDGTTGAHWSFDQAKQVMAQKDISGNPIEFWVTLNMVYSDYCKVAKKLGMGGNIDFYVYMAEAFLNDADSVDDKLAAYYEYVVKH